MAVVPIIVTKNNNTEVPAVLTTKCAKVEKIDETTKKIVRDILDTAQNESNPQAAGLAAPQIGVAKKICLVRKFHRAGQEELIKNYILINPVITNKSTAKDIKWEACLSVPNTYGKVERAKRITVTAQNENGENIKIKADGFFARVIQHEVDHLDGILFTTKIVGKPLTESDYEKQFTGDSQQNL